ncbi:MAG: mucoidy inhibitor MuiA family protein, partial [Bacteroidales bacterium]|nr:mucoidy inhibitor MuiA family protein [Bacteroidales bacterium]
MKHLFRIITVLMLSNLHLAAQNEVTTSIDSVTVYVNGAIVNRSAKFTVKNGTATYLLTGLSSELDKQSLRVGISNQDITIVSVNHRLDTKEDAEKQKLRSAADLRKQILKDSIAILSAKLDVIEEERSLILENKKIAGQNGLTAEQLDKMAQYFRRELTSLENERIKTEKIQKKYTDEYRQILQNANNNAKEISTLVSTVELVLKSDKEIRNVGLTLNYLIPDASWTPFYEVKASESSTLRLGYNARVSQNSHEDWNNVKLTLSTGDPSVSNTKPEFYTMYLPPQKRYVDKGSKPGKDFVYGHVIDENGDNLIGCTVVEAGTTNGTITDIDGKFKLKTQQTNPNLTFAYIGYKSQTLRGEPNMLVILEEDRQALEEVVVVGYGRGRGRGKNASRKADAEEVLEMMEDGAIATSEDFMNYTEPKKNIPMEISQSFTATEFRIDIPYTIKSGDRETDVNMLVYNINAICQYTATPRYSKDVYFVAQIPECYKYSLLQGTANLYLNNIYQGETDITPDNTRDTLELSIGRDKSISVSRKEIKNSTSKSFIGGTYRVVKTFETTVRNNKR